MSLVHPWIIDVVDVLVVAFVVYRLLVLAKGTRAAQMFLGLLLIVGVSLVADWAHLSGVNWLFSNLRTVWVIAFVILFQPELRRALAQIGTNRWLRFFIRFEAESEAIAEVVRSVQELSRLRHGALIVLARDAMLRAYVDTGTRLQARVSAELLQTVFSPKSPLHDGAAIVREDLVEAAGCLLPISENPHLPPRYGLRHRAALGLTEETDAVVLVVSEETGTIGIAKSGIMTHVPNSENLGIALVEVMREG